MKPIFRALSFLALAPLAACSVNPPQISVHGAAVTESTPEGAVVTFHLDAENPNSDPLPLADVRYEVSMNGKTVFRGTRSAEVTVRRFGRQVISLPAAIAHADLDPVNGGRTPYRISGSITYLRPGVLANALFDIAVLRPSTGFSSSGHVDLKPAHAAP